MSVPISRNCLRLSSEVQRTFLAGVVASQPACRQSWRDLTNYRSRGATLTTPLFDFLLPSASNLSPFTVTTSNVRSSRTKQNGLLEHTGSRRSFASSPARSAAIINPRKDENGEEMTISITPRASHRLKEIMSTDSNPNLALRVTVESGGCHGFQYLMSLTDTKSVSPTDDTVFEAPDGTGAKVVMDEPSLELLKGSKIDYTMELIGSQFKIVDNPLATSSCGCGTSFDIKV